MNHEPLTIPCLVVDVGTISYSDALDLQNRLVEKRWHDAIDDVLLLLEHPPVITVGRDGGFDQIKVPAERLAERGVEVYPTNRGGNVTYHGPGQLVGYPILNLVHLKKDAHWYLRTLEGVLIEALRQFAIDAGRVRGKTGVWVNGEKIVSIGVAIRRWITMHGFALNIDPDLSHFLWINPCGFSDAVMTSIMKIDSHRETRLSTRSAVKPDVVSALVAEFGRQFDREMIKEDWGQFQARLI